MINVSKDIWGNAPAFRCRNSRAGPRVDCLFASAQVRCGCMPPVELMKLQATRQLFRSSRCAGVLQCEGAPALRKRAGNACATRNGKFAAAATRVRWFGRRRARGRDRAAAGERGERSAKFCFTRRRGDFALWRARCREGRLRARRKRAQDVSSRFSPGLALGLSTRLLCAVQPVSLLVRDHLGDFETRQIYQRSMSSFEIPKVDAIGLQICHMPKKVELRSRVGRALAATPWRNREKGQPS